MKNKLFIVKKFIMAKNALDAIKKDKTHPVDDVFVDSKWADDNKETNLTSAIGFKEEEDED